MSYSYICAFYQRHKPNKDLVVLSYICMYYIIKKWFNFTAEGRISLRIYLRTGVTSRVAAGRILLKMGKN
jgi:hypothetical protein